VTGRLLEGRVCVVTGGARGIGRAICERFAAEGALVAVADVDAAAAARVSDALSTGGARAIAVTLDVTDRSSVEAADALVASAFGRLDVLVANAGVLVQARVLDLDESQWQRTLDVNLTGVYRCVQVFGRRLVAQGDGGRILVTSSIGGVRGGAFYGAYSATKFGVLGLAQSLADELAPHGVLVNAVCPGVVDTDMMDQLTREQAALTGVAQHTLIARTTDRIPLGRYATPSEVADAFVYLASPLARYVTGQRIIVEGGFLIS
jgi:NAD(P)-dependent dehydrogenase (short-subunit alcohol dehydrogenase family)